MGHFNLFKQGSLRHLLHILDAGIWRNWLLLEESKARDLVSCARRQMAPHRVEYRGDGGWRGGWSTAPALSLELTGVLLVLTPTMATVADQNRCTSPTPGWGCQGGNKRGRCVNTN